MGNKDIIEKVSKLQDDLRDYCAAHRPKLRMEEEKRKNGKAYRFRYYANKNDDDVNEEVKEDVDDGDGDGIYLAMKDIWNTIASILRHVKRYQDHCNQQRKMREIWKKTTKKGRQYAKREKAQKMKKEVSSPR